VAAVSRLNLEPSVSPATWTVAESAVTLPAGEYAFRSPPDRTAHVTIYTGEIYTGELAISEMKGSALMAERAIYRYVPHRRTQARLAGETAGPVKVADQLPGGSRAARFNAWFAVKVTTGVGTMWCAYAFAALALVSLPSAITSGNPVTLVSWISQTFLQLVLLSVIIVGQNVLAAAADKRSEATYKDADAVLHEAVKIQDHLAAQDKVLDALVDKVRALPG
jgi:hypothetical protein